MESILWALDLVVVVFACRWALRADQAEALAEAPNKTKGQG